MEIKKWCLSAFSFLLLVVFVGLGASVYASQDLTPTQLYELPISRLRALANEGNAVAQNELGRRHARGIKGAQQSERLALQWYERGCMQNHGLACNNVGFVYYGRGNHEEAVRWYEMSANLGDPAGQHNLASCYQFGNGVEQSEGEALRWYGRAARQGIRMSIGAYANLLSGSLPVLMDVNQRWHICMWLTLAASQFDGSERGAFLGMLEALEALGLTSQDKLMCQQAAMDFRPKRENQ